MTDAPRRVLFSLVFFSSVLVAEGFSSSWHPCDRIGGNGLRQVLSGCRFQPHQAVEDSTALRAIRVGSIEIAGSSSPAWKDILEVPISIDTQEEFDALPPLKRTAIVCRASVLHLTLLSCFGPLVLRGAIRAGTTTATTMALTPWRALLWTLNVLSWHAFHNLLNDYQDLNDDDAGEDSFRLAYGCHALRQGFLDPPRFRKLMAWVALPGVLLTLGFRGTVLGPAAPPGLLALFFYTIAFKPIALGEALIYFVWGPLLAGYGAVAAGAGVPPTLRLRDPVAALFGLGALGLIMGKHTDKITRSRKRTLPKLLGYPAALWACGLVSVAPHLLMVTTLLRERAGWFHGGSGGAATPSLPLGSLLALLTLGREVPACWKLLRQGKPSSPPPLPMDTVFQGTVADFRVERAWPLWFVAAMGWNAVTFLYLMVIGSGLEWAGRASLKWFL